MNSETRGDRITKEKQFFFLIARKIQFLIKFSVLLRRDSFLLAARPRDVDTNRHSIGELCKFNFNRQIKLMPPICEGKEKKPGLFDHSLPRTKVYNLVTSFFAMLQCHDVALWFFLINIINLLICHSALSIINYCAWRNFLLQLGKSTRLRVRYLFSAYNLLEALNFLYY